MITKEQIPDVLGHTAYDPSHKKLGQINQVFIDTATGEPEWFTVHTGLFGMKETFVPLQPAEVQGDEVVVPYQHDHVKDAPKVDTDQGHLPPEEEERLYEHYGLRPPAYKGGPVGGPPEAETTDLPAEGRVEGRAESQTGRATDYPTDDAMTRSEEQLRVGKERQETGRARLRKYVVTEHEQHTVPVRREKVRVEREPITDENRERANRGVDITEAEHEVILEEERPVVAKETVPVERVRLEKEDVVEEETVGGEVRKEYIETEGTEGTGGTRR